MFSLKWIVMHYWGSHHPSWAFITNASCGVVGLRKTQNSPPPSSRRGAVLSYG